MANIQLIVGLGNPGSEYAVTRHNAGAWFVEKVASIYGADLRMEIKFHGFFATAQISNYSCKLLIPTTYMNCSGRAVQAVANFYKISPSNILVAHDELDFVPGIARLKFDGGHNGHNGLKDIIASLQAKDFYRLRIGIGRPGGANKAVTDYVLAKPSAANRTEIDLALGQAIDILPQLTAGDIDAAIQKLHGSNKCD